MFVVRVENDEAMMYRAFRRAQTARAWAAERNLEDVGCLVDIFETAGHEDSRSAVAATRSGHARELVRGEARNLPPLSSPAASDIDFGGIAAI